MIRKSILFSVFGPLTLGITATLVFLFVYTSKNKAAVTIRNKTGMDIYSGQLKISSLPNEQEIGEIRNGDSAVVQFESFSDGHYVLHTVFKNGKTHKDSGGYVTHGTSFQDEIVLEAHADSIGMKLKQTKR
ncbi:MAG: hypothetical protein M3Y08_17800 [Fibrobacterota bacterium]|nr:hypothetical protein [Fibrobacterota bacterium]